MTNKTLMELLRTHHACSDATNWIGNRGARKAWNECYRGDWLLWISACVGIPRQQLVLAACACARLSLKYLKKGEERPLKAIETAERWAQGKATIEEVRAASYASYAAAYAAYAASAAAYASYAASAAAYASYAAAGAKKRMQLRCAKAVRKVIQFEDVLTANCIK